MKVNKVKQDPRNVPSSAVTPMPILPDDLDENKPLEEEDNADDEEIQEESEQPINEEEDEVKSIKSFEPTKKKGVGNKKKKASNDVKFKNQFKYSSKSRKINRDELREEEEGEIEPLESQVHEEQ